MKGEVWITGVGIVSSIGVGAEAFWTGALAGRSGGRALEHPNLDLAELGTRVAAPVTGFDPEAHHVPRREARVLDPVSQFALAAAHEAVLDAGLEPECIQPRKGYYRLSGVSPEATMVNIGTGIGGLTTMVSNVSAWLTHHRRTACKRYAVPMIIPNAPAAVVAIRFQARGACRAVNGACASGSMAIGEGAQALARGEADVAICGASDAILADPELFGLLGFDLLKTMTRRNHEPTRASRPFDRDRDGYLLSEGAAVVVLERAEFARARGVRPYARVAGYGATCDARSILQIDPEGTQVARAMALALEDGGLTPEDVDHVAAHGIATVENDRVETRAIRQVFGAHADRLAVSSIKSMTGHPVGAAGAMSTVAAALAMTHRVVPPTINLEHPDPACDLDYVPGTARSMEVRAALVNAFGFGGHNACLVLTSP